jgi:hypothetical protein
LSIFQTGERNVGGDSPWDGSLRKVIEQVLEEELEGTHRLIGQPSRSNFRT